MKRRFDIVVDITGCHVLHSEKGTVNMVTFGGWCECPFFRGRILPGGVDTQHYPSGKPGTLSARYMLEGTDESSTPCRLFIDNCGEQGDDFTTPRFLTDSPRLKWLEDTPFTGRIEGREGGVIIHFEEVR